MPAAQLFYIFIALEKYIFNSTIMRIALTVPGR